MPDPVTPPKTTAAIGAEMMAETMPQIEPADRDVGDAEVAAHEEQHDQADDRADDADADDVAHDREERHRPSASGLKKLNVPSGVERQEPVVADRAQDHDDRRAGAEERSSPQLVFGRLRNQPHWATSPAKKPIHAATIANGAAKSLWNGAGST